MRCAIIDVANNLIVDVIVADPAVDPAPDGLMLAWVPDFVNAGDAWNNGVFVQVVTPPTPGPPRAVPTTSASDVASS